jgi:hypothetical protein
MFFQPEKFRHQGGILVDIDSAEYNGFGPQRLDKADALEFLRRQMHQRQAGGGFAAVLAGGGNEYFECHGIAPAGIRGRVNTEYLKD